MYHKYANGAFETFGFLDFVRDIGQKLLYPVMKLMKVVVLHVAISHTKGKEEGIELNFSLSIWILK